MVDYDGILFVVPSQASGVEVCAANGADRTIDHDDFCVMEAWRVKPDSAAFLHQFVSIVKAAVGCQRDVAAGGKHDFNFYTALDSVGQ